jgi:signal transduction histidine kinase
VEELTTAMTSRVRHLDAAPPELAVMASDSVRTHQQISHDIHHELGTIMLLATLLMDAPELSSDSRRRARLILGETRWLEQLHRAYESTDAGRGAALTRIAPTRVDQVGVEVVEALRLSTLGTINVSTVPVSARVNHLALWRALRNVLDNAVRAAGPNGTVGLAIWAEGGCVIMQVDDDGPGFGAGDPGRSSLGLNIVQEFVASAGGLFEISRGFLGGCCVRLQLPEAMEDAIGGATLDSEIS